MQRHVLAMVVLLGLVTPLPEAAGAAPLYRWMDPQGTITYSDRPRQPAEAGDPAAPTAGLQAIDELLEVAGLRRQLAGMATRMRQPFWPRSGAVSAEDQATVQRIVTRAFAADALYPLIRAEFARYADDGKIAAAMSFYRSPVGGKMVALEIVSAASSSSNELAEFASRLQTQPPSRERLALVQRLDAAVGASELSLDIVAAVARSMTSALNGVLPPDRRSPPGVMERQLGQFRAQALEPLRQASLLSMLFTYRSVSDDELEPYVAFVESEAGRWFSTVTRASFVSALSVAAERTALELVRILSPAHWAR